jgi:CHAD domain-containing protein
MTLELPDLKNPGASLRIVLNELAQFIAQNVNKLPEDSATRIHDIRVSAKKIRSLLRMADTQISSEERLVMVKILRTIKDTFSGSRDEDVMRQRLQQIFSKDRVTKVKRKLGLDSPEPPPEPDLQVATTSTASLDAQLSTLPLDGLTPATLVENAATAYRRARRIMQKCKKSPEDDTMHAWRKRVKDVFYHAMALSVLPAMEEFAKPLDPLAESLGEYHDLALLGERARGHEKISARISAEKRKVGKRCFKAAAPLFKRPTGKFAKNLGRALREFQS